MDAYLLLMALNTNHVESLVASRSIGLPMQSSCLRRIATNGEVSSFCHVNEERVSDEILSIRFTIKKINYLDMFVYKCVYISLNSFFSSRKSACISKCSIVFFDYIQLLIYIRISFKNYIRHTSNFKETLAEQCHERCCFCMFL